MPVFACQVAEILRYLSPKSRTSYRVINHFTMPLEMHRPPTVKRFWQSEEQNSGPEPHRPVLEQHVPLGQHLLAPLAPQRSLEEMPAEQAGGGLRAALPGMSPSASIIGEPRILLLLTPATGAATPDSADTGWKQCIATAQSNKPTY